MSGHRAPPSVWVEPRSEYSTRDRAGHPRLEQRARTGPCAQDENLRESGAVRARSMGDLVASAASQQAPPSVLQGIDGGIHNIRHRLRSIVSANRQRSCALAGSIASRTSRRLVERSVPFASVAQVFRVDDDLVDHRAQGFGLARAVELRLAVAVFLALGAASLLSNRHHVSERVLAAERPGMR